MKRDLNMLDHLTERLPVIGGGVTGVISSVTAYITLHGIWETIVLTFVGGIVGGAAGWLIKNFLDYVKKKCRQKFGREEPSQRV